MNGVNVRVLGREGEWQNQGGRVCKRQKGINTSFNSQPYLINFFVVALHQITQDTNILSFLKNLSCCLATITHDDKTRTCTYM